ncbi:MAG: hypothetical protein KGP12_12575 [Actinomycetales bacterium]|nr:hypothetical protein [Actinomycetales bacterium]
MRPINCHRVSAYWDSGDFIAKCFTCRWNGPRRSERPHAVDDAVGHLTENMRLDDVPIPAQKGTRRYTSADYARWSNVHARYLARNRARAAEHRDPVDPTPEESLAGRRLRDLLDALVVLTYQPLQVLRRNGEAVLTTIHWDIEEDLAATRTAIADLERRMRDKDQCFPQIGLVAFNGRNSASRLQTLAADRRSGRHAYAWHEQQPEGECVVCTCGVMVRGTLNVDFTEQEFSAASGHRPGRAWTR